MGVVAAIVHQDWDGELLTTASNVHEQLTHPRPESLDTYWYNMDYALFNTAGEAVQAEIRAAQATAQGGGGYGSPPQQYQAYRPSWVLESNICRIQEAIQQKRLQSVYPPDDPRIKEKAQRAAREVDELAAAWHAPRVLAVDIKKK